MYVALLFLATALLSCSKSSPNANSTVPAASLQIFVNYGNNLISGATVYLFTSQLAWDNFAYYGNTSYISIATTNSNGVASFSNLSPIAYYWLAKDSCENSVSDSVHTKKVLTLNVVNGGNAALLQSGEIAINNINATSSIDMEINGLPAGNLAAGKSKSYPCPLGKYTVTAYDAFDSTTQTVNTDLLSCGSVQTLNFNP